MQVDLDKHTIEVIKDFERINEPVLASVIQLAAEVSYLKGYTDALEQEAKNQKIDMDKIDINLGYEGIN